MKKTATLLTAAFLCAAGSFAQNFAQSNLGTTLKRPKMQVVFALDATGSMSGLISAAKDKIWSIVNSLTQTENTPDIEVGLVFYRDRGDAFITKRIALTDSMDKVYSELMNMQADGGGDGPESVNQGLNEAVTLFNWAKDTTTYKAVFLVGDYEPHMDYKNDVPYYVSCKIAKSKDIVLNTILMGNNSVAEKIWKEIALCNEGAYVNVNMNVNDISVTTPYDSIIAALSDRLDDMRYYYGKTATITHGAGLKTTAKNITQNTTLNVKAQRAEYNAFYYKKSAKVKQNELLSDYASGNVALDSLKQDELPAEFKHLSSDSLKAMVKNNIASRDSLQSELNTAIAKRNSYIQSELSKRNATEVKGSFNSVIYDHIQMQTKRKKIYLRGEAKF